MMGAAQRPMDVLPTLSTVPLGSLYAHRVSFAEALDHIIALVRFGQGGYVVTPNVDHICVASEHAAFADAHRSASLSTVDGTPLMWLASACRTPLPEKISGSDLMMPVMTRAAAEGLSVAFFGGTPDASAAAAKVAQAKIPTLRIVSRVWPRYSPGTRTNELDIAVSETREQSPDVVFVAMGTPNQELFMHEYRDAFAPGVLIGIGAGLDFLAGTKSRSPLWVSKAGLEWVYRLVQEPKRMASRYLVRDRAIIGIALRQIVAARRS